MKTPVLFKKFNYSIVPAISKKSIAGTKINTLGNEVSLVNVDIDFEQEDFKLEGDWQYMMAANKHAEKKWFACHQQRVSIEASIYPGVSIDLTDENNDGLVFIIDGFITDNGNRDACTGLLVLDLKKPATETANSKWNISFYLYDNAHDDCEIAFKLPVYGRHLNDYLN